MGCLAGVMFESGQFERPDLAYQKEIITWLTGLVLLFSFLYYLTVFIAEIGGSNYCQCFATKKAARNREETFDQEIVFEEMKGGNDGEEDFTAINPMVAARLMQGGGKGGTRSVEDWELLTKELE